MTVWIVEVCEDDEYGFKGIYGVYASKEAAHAAAKKAGLQNIDDGEPWNYRTDYYEVYEWGVDQEKEPQGSFFLPQAKYPNTYLAGEILPQA